KASEAGSTIARLEEVIRKFGERSSAGPSKGRSGKDGGKDGGTGPGQGKMRRDKRVERMLRWHMRFTANTGEEYLAQLRSMGAILAIPMDNTPKPKYQLVRDLRRGGKLLDEDVSKINRIYWIDSKDSSVRDLIAALGLTLRHRPSHFVAFMPEKL